MIDLKTLARGLEAPRLRLISTGAGRDSMTLIAIAEKGELLVDGELLSLSQFDGVVFSDLGSEWPLTYEAARVTRDVCSSHGVSFYWLRKPSKKDVSDYASKLYPEARQAVLKRRKRTGKKHQVSRVETSPWLHRPYPTIEAKARAGGYHRRLPILDEVMLLGRTTTRQSAECTVQHKIEPIRALLSDLSEQRFGMDLAAWGDAVEAGHRLPHQMILGIAADEASRARPWSPGKGSLWGVQDVYPLVDAGVDKEQESSILVERGWGWVHKSGCMGCHYQPTSWFYIVRAKYPAVWKKLLAVEERARSVRSSKGLSMLWIKGSGPLKQQVTNWGKSTRVLKLQISKGVLSEGFRRRLERIDPGFRVTQEGHWVQPATLTPDTLPSDLLDQMFEELMSKGYNRSCAFGER